MVRSFVFLALSFVACRSSSSPDVANSDAPQCEPSLRETLDVDGCVTGLSDCDFDQPIAFAIAPQLRSALLKSPASGCRVGALRAGRGLFVEGKQVDAGVVVFRGYASTEPLLGSKETIMCGVCSGVLVYDGGWVRLEGVVADDVDPTFAAP